jgi:hypothetical protein
MLFALVSLAHAGWVQPAGQHYVKVGGRAIPGSLTAPATKASPPQLRGGVGLELDRYLDIAFEVYGEYGLTDTWTGIVKAMPLGWSSLGDNSTVYSGVAQIGVRRALLQGRHNISVQADLGYTPNVGDVDLMVSPLVVDGVSYKYIPSESGAYTDLLQGYGTTFKDFWFKAELSAAAWSNPRIDPAILGEVQLGHAGRWGNRWMLALPFREHLGSNPIDNLAGGGQSEYLAIRVDYTVTFGDGFGLNTAMHLAAYVAGNEASGVLPLYVEHQGGPGTD